MDIDIDINTALDVLGDDYKIELDHDLFWHCRIRKIIFRNRWIFLTGKTVWGIGSTPTLAVAHALHIWRRHQ